MEIFGRRLVRQRFDRPRAVSVDGSWADAALGRPVASLHGVTGHSCGLPSPANTSLLPCHGLNGGGTADRAALELPGRGQQPRPARCPSPCVAVRAMPIDLRDRGEPAVQSRSGTSRPRRSSTIRAWDAGHEVHREVFARMGRAWIPGLPIPVEYGGHRPRLRELGIV